jgi:hypothetical protein
MALMALPNIIRYFRDCYEEDNRRSTLWNIFNASVTHRLFVEREERDVVYISLAVDSSTHPAALRFLDKPDVFNVSITRARVAQRIYTSIDPAQLDSGSLLRAYLHHIDASQKETLAPRENTHRDRFLSEAEAALKGIGCDTWTGLQSRWNVDGSRRSKGRAQLWDRSGRLSRSIRIGLSARTI